MKIKKINKYQFEVGKEGKMNVPLLIFADEKMLSHMQEDLCISQGINMATLPGIYKQAVMMPDAHQGYGFPVGGVAAFDIENGCISPGGIGYDINCSVSLLACELDKTDVEPKINQLLDRIFSLVPCGVGEKSSFRVNEQEFEEILNTGVNFAVKKGFATPEDKEHCEEYGLMEEADASKLSQRAKDRGFHQLGTLGAGNHFLEIQYVDEIFDPIIAEIFGIMYKNQICVMIHCGSRGLGHQNCTDYLRIAEGRFPEITHKLVDRELAYFPASSKEASYYFSAMSAAANFAFVNHRIIAHNIRKVFTEIFGQKTELSLIYHIAHNMAKLEEYVIDGKKRAVYVHRKGATRALPPLHPNNPKKYMKTGHPILIPGSMGTSSYVLAGTELAFNETFASTPHGAGRQMSRHQAMRLYRGEKIKGELEHQKIHVKAASWRGICEEAPLAYKNIDEVVEIAYKAGIGKHVARLKPFGVIKG